MRKIINKIRNKKGFTLAELLIVVAIIAVLVAIAIPIFTSQLEKSREATDVANIRSAYAEVMAAAVTGEGTDTVSVSEGVYTYKGDVTAKQKQTGWQSTNLDSVGGLSVGDSKDVEASTTGWTVKYTESSDTVSIEAKP